MLRTGKNLEQYLRSITSVSLDTLYSLQVPNEDIISVSYIWFFIVKV